MLLVAFRICFAVNSFRAIPPCLGLDPPFASPSRLPWPSSSHRYRDSVFFSMCSLAACCLSNFCLCRLLTPVMPFLLCFFYHPFFISSLPWLCVFVFPQWGTTETGATVSPAGAIKMPRHAGSMQVGHAVSTADAGSAAVKSRRRGCNGMQISGLKASQHR